MTLEKFIKTLPWGEKAKLAHFLGVTRVTITNYGRSPRNPRKITPTPEKAALIIEFSKGRLTLEDILGPERAEKIKKIWGSHAEN